LRLPGEVRPETADFTGYSTKTIWFAEHPCFQTLFTFQNIKNLASKTYFAEVFGF
jgi:hypothetical protein